MASPALTFPAALAAQLAPFLPPSGYVEKGARGAIGEATKDTGDTKSTKDTKDMEGGVAETGEATATETERDTQEETEDTEKKDTETDTKEGTKKVTLTFATSLDASLALTPGTQTHLSGPLSKAMTHHLRAHHGAILIGVATAVADDPGLNCRLHGAGLDRQPVPIVLDPRARWAFTEDSRVLRAARDRAGRPPIILTADSTPPHHYQARQALLERHGGRYLSLPVDDVGRFRWRPLLALLERQLDITTVMVEGGGRVINSLLEDEDARKLVGAVIVTIAPTWLGRGGVVVSPERGPGFVPPRLRDVAWLPMGEDVVLCGRL